MKLLILGEYNSNAGPANVNKKIISNLSNSIMYIKSKSKINKIFELIFKLINSDIILISGFDPRCSSICKFTKIINKKTIYLMHGYAKYDNEINHLGLTDKILKKEYEILSKVSFILCVSKKFSEWVTIQLPEFEDKISYINSGIDIKYNNYFFQKRNNEKFVIALSGGNRRIKNNVEVCKAVKILFDLGFNIEVNIYGRIYDNNDTFMKYPFLNFKGQISQEDFYTELKKTNLFILNTEVESFGLSAADALVCGCDILLSSNCGILSILDYTSNDIISDPHNIDEIVEKIKYFINDNSNNNRLLSTINFEECSWKNRSKQLIKICEFIYMDRDLKKIKEEITKC